MKKTTYLLSLILFMLFLQACRTSRTADRLAAGTPSPGKVSATPIPTFTPIPLDQAPRNSRVEITEKYPINALIPRDGIAPVYEPQFTTASQAPISNGDLVLALEIEGQAKAYPIKVLHFREMVNDQLAGIPILVTW